MEQKNAYGSNRYLFFILIFFTSTASFRLYCLSQNTVCAICHPLLFECTSTGSCLRVNSTSEKESIADSPRLLSIILHVNRRRDPFPSILSHGMSESRGGGSL